MRSTYRSAVLAVLLLVAGSAAARADQDYIKVQPIQVCDSAGANCATVTLDKASVQQIYNQAGIAIQWAPTIQYNAPNTAVTSQAGIGLTTTVQGSGGDPTDQAHVLLRGYQQPPNPAPADPQVLNLFYVGALIRSDGGPIDGLALVGGNGMIVADQSTGLGTGVGVPVDTPAHEIGHNLGLRDVDLASPGVVISAADQPYNLMDSLHRITPPNGAISTDGVTGIDRLVSQQIGIVRQPLFTVDGGSAQLSASGTGVIYNCSVGQNICDLNLILPTSSSSERLTGVKLRYAASPPSAGFVGGAGSTACGGSYVDADQLASGGYELNFSFGSGCTPGQNAVLGTVFNSLVPMVPLSAEFDFSGGTTSTALFSASGVADSTVDAVYAINGPTHAAPSFVLPTTDEIDIDPAPLQSTTVPEPASLAALCVGLLSFGMFRRRALI